jgi:2-methylisocitrate lyase-like PEP mutase family enzyme
MFFMRPAFHALKMSPRLDISTLIKSVDRPVNVLLGFGQLRVADLSALGVRRVSVGSGLCRAALGAFLNCALELRDGGTFILREDAASFAEINNVFTGARKARS